MSFDLTGRENILIYGAGEQGKKFVRLFNDNGFPIKAVLDKRAEELEQITVEGHEICVIDPEQYVVDSQNEVAVISLWNAVRHEQIAAALQKKGFKKIIYIPMSTVGDYKLMSDMRRAFNKILDGKVYLNNIPEYLDIVKDVKNHSDENILYLPIELLFSEEKFEIPIENLSGSEYLKRKNVMKSAGENIVNFKAYYQMYKYLDKAEGNCADYLNMQANETDTEFATERKRILKDRYELFQIYEKAFELDRGFFLDCAPNVIWNQKGYFNIVDGHHRVCYLFYKGIWDVPVRILEKDKVHLEMLKKIPDIFLSESLALVNAKSSLFWRKQNAILCSCLLRKDVLGKRIYTDLGDAGYVARYCCRVGCEQCIDMETEEKIEFARQLCSWFQYNECLIINQKMGDQLDVDIAIIDEKYISDIKSIRAHKYIIKFEKNGDLYDAIMLTNIPYKNIGTIFNGEREYMIIQVDGGNACFH